jgi:exodeoxyribonuclease VII small subunit
MLERKKMTKKINFEEALNKLEKIVENFESGKLSLEEMINKYQEGSELAKLCLTKLEEAENMIKLLNADGSINENVELDNGN